MIFLKKPIVITNDRFPALPFEYDKARLCFAVTRGCRIRKISDADGALPAVYISKYIRGTPSAAVAEVILRHMKSDFVILCGAPLRYAVSRHLKNAMIAGSPDFPVISPFGSISDIRTSHVTFDAVHRCLRAGDVLFDTQRSFCERVRFYCLSGRTPMIFADSPAELFPRHE